MKRFTIIIIFLAAVFLAPACLHAAGIGPISAISGAGDSAVVECGSTRVTVSILDKGILGFSVEGEHTQHKFPSFGVSPDAPRGKSPDIDAGAGTVSAGGLLVSFNKTDFGFTISNNGKQVFELVPAVWTSATTAATS